MFTGWSSAIRRILAWGPPAFWALVLFLLSELRVTPRVARSFFAYSDKLVHFGLYFALGFLLALGRRIGGDRVSHVLLIGLGIGYGAVDEWHQSFVPRRSPDVRDWIADAAGVVIGYAVFTASGVMRRNPSPREELE